MFVIGNCILYSNCSGQLERPLLYKTATISDNGQASLITVTSDNGGEFRPPYNFRTLCQEKTNICH